jgi:hypothetical protein
MLMRVTLTAFIAIAIAAPTTNSTLHLATQADACSLLTDAQVNAAIEATTQPGRHVAASSTKQCMWSDDPDHALDHRRVVLTYSAPTSFDIGKKVSHPAAESVSGVGDDAYYEFFGTDAPALVVKKGGTVFTIRLLNGFKAKALDQATVKSRELALAKAVAAKV